MERILKSRLWTSTGGQDLLEFALMAGFAAVALTTVFPGLTQNVLSVLTTVTAALTGNPPRGIN